MGIVAFLAVSLSIAIVSAAPRPNVLLFLADDLGWGDFSCYGHPTQEEGAVDELARHGVRFTQAYAAAVACTPSRAALLTGQKCVSKSYASRNLPSRRRT